MYKRIAYIAGPYRADTLDGMHRNVQDSRYWTRLAWRSGWMPIDPLANSAFMDGIIPAQAFLDGDLELLTRFRPRRDAVLLRPGWCDSVGAMAERERAVELGLEIIQGDLGAEACGAWMRANAAWPVMEEVA